MDIISYLFEKVQSADEKNCDSPIIFCGNVCMRCRMTAVCMVFGAGIRRSDVPETGVVQNARNDTWKTNNVWHAKSEIFQKKFGKVLAKKKEMVYNIYCLMCDEAGGG